MKTSQMARQAVDRLEYLKPLRREMEAVVAKVAFTDQTMESFPLQDSSDRETNILFSRNQG